MSGKNGKITLERIYEEMQRGFARVDERFNEMERRFDRGDLRVDEILKNLGRYHRDHEERIRALEDSNPRKAGS
jgi:hypothetical protein